MNTFVKTISSSNLSMEFLKSMNGLLSLTKREMELFALMLDLTMSSAKQKKKSIDCAENRKFIMNSTGVTRENLSRYIKSYREKGLLLLDNKLLVVNKALVPLVISGKTVQITMVLKVKQNDI